MTAEQVEARDFTYVQAQWSNPAYRSERFLVGTPYLAEAKTRATAVLPILFPGLGAPDRIYYYPRTYVAKARRLLAQGLHD